MTMRKSFAGCSTKRVLFFCEWLLSRCNDRWRGTRLERRRRMKRGSARAEDGGQT